MPRANSHLHRVFVLAQDIVGEIVGLHIMPQIVPQREPLGAHCLGGVMGIAFLHEVLLPGLKAAVPLHIGMRTGELTAGAVHIAGDHQRAIMAR